MVDINDTTTKDHNVEESILTDGWLPANLDAKRISHEQGNLAHRFLDTMAIVLKHTNYGHALDHYSRVNARCARCSVACPLYSVSGDPKDAPCRRSGLLLDVYRRHFSYGGQLKARVTLDPGLTDAAVCEMAEHTWNCTMCRRCQPECPMGVDHGLITHLNRWILALMGLAPHDLVEAGRNQLMETGNVAGVERRVVIDTLNNLAREIAEEKGISIDVPYDEEGAEYLFVPPVLDILADPETIKGIFISLHQAGVSWTMSSEMLDASNYGIFYNDTVLERNLKRLENVAQRLEIKKILIGESGHAYRTVRLFYDSFHKFSELPIVSVIELTNDAIHEGKLKLKKQAGRATGAVFYHDPCQIARQGWLVDQPRNVLSAATTRFIQGPHHGRDTDCCGGGGGLAVTDLLRTHRTRVTGKNKAELLAKKMAGTVVAPCDHCRKQFRDLAEDYDLHFEVTGLHAQVYRAFEPAIRI